jgi:hypothetical protein
MQLAVGKATTSWRNNDTILIMFHVAGEAGDQSRASAVNAAGLLRGAAAGESMDQNTMLIIIIRIMV